MYGLGSGRWGLKKVTMNGEDGDDLLLTALDGKTWFYGGADDDEIGAGTYSTNVLHGGTGSDYVVDVGGSTDYLYGEDDPDCLQDAGGWTVFDCGGPTPGDYYVEAGNETACESVISCCNPIESGCNPL